MSWDIVLLNSTEKIIFIENIDEEKLLPIDFDKILLKKCNLKIEDYKEIENCCESISSHSIDNEINFYFDTEPSSIKIVSLYSERALFRILELAKLHNWQIFDTSLGEMLDIENPNINGYHNHKNYVDRIMKTKNK